MRALTYYVGASIDGFIAGPGGDVGAFDPQPDLLEWITTEHPDTLPTHVRPIFGLGDAHGDVDTVVMGRGTYQPALDEGITSPYAHLRQYVVSTTVPTDVDPAVTVVVDDPVATVRSLKAEPGGRIWLAGGGTLAASLADEIDELVVKIYPVVLGDGIPMFAGAARPLGLRSVGVHTFDSGVIVASYERSGDRTPLAGAGR